MSQTKPQAYKPLIAIAPGDPAGIGPEVTARALLTNHKLFASSRPFVVADPAVFKALPGIPADRIKTIEDPGELALADRSAMENQIFVLPANSFAMHEAWVDVWGTASKNAAEAAIAWVRKGAALAQSGAVDALVTGPVNKEALRMTGADFIGHTELLAGLAGNPPCTTMLATPGLRVTHVTRHIAFRDIAATLCEETIGETIRITYEGMQRLGFASPRLAVAGLNPHNGDNGLLGDEEARFIASAVQKMQKAGITVTGPVPADSVFFQAIAGKYDVVVCMYHDQGHIAVKTHDFTRSITITLGLPYLRTSVDHGTAFDIAGQDRADFSSMEEALRQAARYAAAFAARKHG